MIFRKRSLLRVPPDHYFEEGNRDLGNCDRSCIMDIGKDGDQDWKMEVDLISWGPGMKGGSGYVRTEKVVEQVKAPQIAGYSTENGESGENTQ